MKIVKEVIEKDIQWVIKLVLFQVGILSICGLIYIGKLLS